MSSFTCHGWTIFFYPLFNEQWVELSHRVRILKTKLTKEEFIKHPDAKLLKALDISIKKKYPKILLLPILFYKNLYKNMVVSKRWDYLKDIDCSLEHLKNKKLL